MLMTYNIATDEFPYQLVILLGGNPQVGETVYGGPHGWYPQVTIKRRFGLRALSEAELLGWLHAFMGTVQPFSLEFGQILTGRLPVEVIEVVNKEPQWLHRSVMTHLGRKIRSRYPDREGGRYFPHMTVEWNGRHVVDAGQFVSSRWNVDRIWLIKDDVEADDSRIFASFPLCGELKQ